MKEAPFEDIKAIIKSLNLSPVEYDRTLAQSLVRIYNSKGDISNERSERRNAEDQKSDIANDRQARDLFVWLLQNGTDPYHAHDGLTFLHHLAGLCELDTKMLISLLEIAKGLGIRLSEIVNLGNYSALLCKDGASIMGSSQKFLNYMIENGADLNLVDSENQRTFAFYARYYYNVNHDYLTYCDLTRRDKNGNTALLYYCMFQNKDVTVIQQFCKYAVDQDFIKVITLLGPNYSQYILKSSGYNLFYSNLFIESEYAKAIPKDIVNIVVKFLDIR